MHPPASERIARAPLVSRPTLPRELVGMREGIPDAARRWRDENAQQVRIEQRTIIRIIPRPLPRHPELLVALPMTPLTARIVERKMGKCVTTAMLTGVQPAGNSHLLLFMRDRTVVSTTLERACRSRDFYSGFYFARTADGKLCVDRDSLLSRSGVNCKLTRFRQLVAKQD